MNRQSNQASAPAPLKASIRDLARLHQFYAPSDEVLWTYFNTRVLMNEAIEVDDFMLQRAVVDEQYRHITTVGVG